MKTTIAEPRHSDLICSCEPGVYKMAWTEWGDAANPHVLVCVHGLLRTGRDFDTFAQALSASYRVVCPDIVGRGRSDWLPAQADVVAGYSVPRYARDCLALLDRIGAAEVDWVGTSMGGLIGMAIAAMPETPVRRLVLNDVGPVLDARALARIGDYVGADIGFASFDEGVDYIRAISASFGPHTPEQWRTLAAHLLVEREALDGRGWRLHYDPRIGAAFRALVDAAPEGTDIALWDVYDAIRCPTLAIRGALSDLLSPQTHAEMGRRGPRARLVEFAGIGHAPTLMHADQIEVVKHFLLDRP